MTSPLRIAVAGPNGKMGQKVVAAFQTDNRFVYLGGIGRPGSIGAGLLTREEAIRIADVIVDFSTASAATALVEDCAKLGGPAVIIGATGFDAEEEDRIAKAARHIAILRSGNFSVGLNMLPQLVADISAKLQAATWDIEIVEAHHRHKVDAPSGTALMLGDAAAQGRGVDLETVGKNNRVGVTGARPDGEIGFAVVRAGGIVGEHSVIFASEEEVITISHSALGRGMFAKGVILASQWIAGKPAGEYSMADVV
ncbi:4-hydroxy-tetrahydrodipicolinate reductase [Agrobacterium sp.]|uniref:4-hydroxy-tetrahydrodipicolinate reductase n=1 Tax=Agrobacterium sp. TaxID=361 RepID=UPI0028AE41EB|nr:4-hydroxy-tetrahydrodipicolinate reductase [Agrobacterium sp.]